MFRSKILSFLATVLMLASLAVFTIVLMQYIPVEFALIAPALVPVKFKSLKDAKGTYEDRMAKQKQIYDEAGEGMDMDKVKCIEGDTTAKLAKMAELEAEMSDCIADIKAFEEIAKKREDFLELERKNKGVVKTPGSVDVPGGSQAKEFTGLGDLFIASDTYKEYVGDNGRKGSLAKNVKASVIGGDFGLKTLFQTTAGWAPETTRTGLVVPDAQRPIEVTDLLPAGRTSQAAVVYMEETTFTNTAAEAAEGGQYPEATLALTEQSVPVRKIAVFIPVTDEQLEDELQVSSYLNNRLPFMIRQRLDGQIINGDGIAPNITGILNTAGILTQARGGDTNEDAFYKAMVLVMTTGQAMPSNHIINPTNWQTIRLRKTADGIYIFGDPAQAGAISLWGLPIAQAQVIAAGTGITGDFPNFIELTERRGIEVKISDSHDDFFIKGKQAIRADMRVAMPVYRPAAFASVTGLN